MKFEEYNISEDIKRNLKKMGFKKPTDIQFKSIPPILRGEDLLAIAQTGTGKTAAFAIPVIHRIHSFKRSSRALGIKCLVMAPTRELALQIGNVFNTIAKGTKVKAFTLHGGVEQERQINKIQEGIDILITTPGRMFDLINQDVIDIERVNTLVLDEADHMLDLGFIEDIKYVKKMLKMRHQTLFFSATINPTIKKLAFSQVKSSAIRIQIAPKDPVSKNVAHSVIMVEMDDKRFFLEKVIRDNPESKIIVFVRTRVRAERVQKAMERVDIKTEVLHGERDQNERMEIMDKFRKGKHNILIATDISARGIDVPDINIVVNYDLPEKSENYVHRVGRTGRGFNKGDAISFCSSDEKELLDEIETFVNKPIDIIRVSKNEYKEIIAEPQNEFQSIEELMMDHELWLKDSKKKKKKKKK